MVKAIMSSKYLLKKIKHMPVRDEYLVSFLEGCVKIDDVEIECTRNHRGSVTQAVAGRSLKNLKTVLSILDDQPIVIGMNDNGWLWVMEAIL